MKKEMMNLPQVGQVTSIIFLVDFLLEKTGGAVIKNLAILPFLEDIMPGWAARNK